MKLLALLFVTVAIAGCSAKNPTCERPYMHTPVVPCEDCAWNEK